MSAFLYGLALQLRMDIRSKTMLVACYAVPLLFFAVMGGIFTSVMPGSKNTLIQSMSVFGISMGALIGLPPSLVEIYGSDIKKVYRSNGVPLYSGLVLTNISAFIHLMIMSAILYAVAPLAFDAAIPKNPALYFVSLAVFTAASLSAASIVGLAVKDQAKTSMISIIAFLPSILLSGIMFPTDMLPRAFKIIGKAFPASWGFLLMTDRSVCPAHLLALLLIFGAASAVCGLLLKKAEK